MKRIQPLANLKNITRTYPTGEINQDGPYKGKEKYATEEITEDDIKEGLTGIPFHPNCACDIVNMEWLIGPNACDDCKEAKEIWDKEYGSGNVENAEMIYNKHKNNI